MTAGTDVFYKAMRDDSNQKRYCRLEWQPCARWISDPANPRIKHDPDALALSLNTCAERPIPVVRKLPGLDALRTLHGIDGTEVHWDHVRGKTTVQGQTQAPTGQSLDWTSFHEAVNRRERQQGPSDRGDGTCDDEPFAAWARLKILCTEALLPHNGNAGAKMPSKRCMSGS